MWGLEIILTCTETMKLQVFNEVEFLILNLNFTSHVKSNRDIITTH